MGPSLLGPPAMQAPGGSIPTTPTRTRSLGSAHLTHLPGLLGARTPGEEPGQTQREQPPSSWGPRETTPPCTRAPRWALTWGLSSSVNFHFRDSNVR